ncbi:hypothetical protein AQUCO_04500133v1 [Aquilegia coerulea]|uniref:Histone-lysine N-methyltransferase ASHH1 n=1 Tax=Aquilegia coerulea TaxID=218851 RepID=A0A2G5CN85_AQUCA|nr:hypothetical protein AQUCO_04500133v1 [Aquilegia coerulea]
MIISNQDQYTDDGPLQYIHIEQNEFMHRKHKKQKEEDIAICNCNYNISDPDSACGDRCLNVFTSTECTPGYCPCGSYCKNQRFQKCENAKSKLVKTEGRGWGVLADENIKAGQFIIEYCGEVISRKEARRRSHAYESQGLLDAYIISLNSHESIDATKKGSLARFINHSCLPNCVTRKWTVLGEIRVGIFSKQDIPVGTELAYDYNFEWYGGAKVRCLCGAPFCSGFLGAKSRGFQEDTYLWEDDDDRYSIENIPTYDSEEDEPTSKLATTMESSKLDCNTDENHDMSMRMNDNMESKHPLQSTALVVVEPLNLAVPMEGVVMHETKTEVNKERNLHLHDTDQTFGHKNAIVPRIKMPLSNKKSNYSGKLKQHAQKDVDAKRVAQLLSSQEAREEVYNYEEVKKQTVSQLGSLYDEIRPAIEEHERDSQDSVPTRLAERWIEARCSKMKADFDLSFSIIKHVTCTSRRPGSEADGEKQKDVKLLTN